MAKILITPEEMDAASKLFKEGANESQQLASKLNSKMQSMHGMWEGMTQQKFFERYETDKKNMDTYIKMLQSVSEELDKISARFRQADQQG